MTNFAPNPENRDEGNPHTIAIRAHAEPDTSKMRPPGKLRLSVGDPGPSNITIITDTETGVDAAQQLRFGTGQVREDGELIENGEILFYSQSLPRKDRRVLRRYAKTNGLTLLTLDDFIESIVYGIGYDLEATFVLFNAAFDFSRMAYSHGPAKTHFMRDGFSLALSHDPRRGHLQVKRIAGNATMLRVASPEHRPFRKRNTEVPASQGYFADVRDFARAQTNRDYSLKNLGDFLQTEHRKLDSTVVSGPVTDELIRYALRDTQVTWECYEKLKDQFDKHGLTLTPIHKVHSVASMGKGYLKQMGIRSLGDVQPDFPPDLKGRIMCAYHGGRAEVHLRRMITQVIYCDFLSMYPTVCTLMGLWRFMIATGIHSRKATDETRRLLASVTIDDLQRPETWKRLTTIVRVRPSHDIFPVRAKYGCPPSAGYNIGLNYLTCSQPLWFTLADCIAAKLLGDGKVPEVLEAIAFEPKTPQEGLTPVRIGGEDAFLIDPLQEDFFKRTIELRIETKQKMRNASGAKLRVLDAQQNFLKTIASSTAYGISIQVDSSESAERERLMVYGPHGGPRTFESRAVERPGPYFNPLLGATTTAAARLMLAITETLIKDHGLDWAFCDTDSMAIAKPEEMTDGEFLRRVEAIRDWFVPLNPYNVGGGHLLKIEETNYGLKNGKPTGELVPLFCYPISSKRYVLFNLDPQNRPILRKASRHGLAHLRAPDDVIRPDEDEE
jgi:hypothetical protein